LRHEFHPLDKVVVDKLLVGKPLSHPNRLLVWGSFRLHHEFDYLDKEEVGGAVLVCMLLMVAHIHNRSDMVVVE
jgi:hypothetical protein